jgi:hypothetical protein
VSSCILHTIQALDNVFRLTKVENFGLKFFGSGCEHFMVSERRFIGVGRAEEVDTAPGEVPVTLASQSLNYQCRLES